MAKEKDPNKKKNRNWVPIVTLIFQTLADFFGNLKIKKKENTLSSSPLKGEEDLDYDGE